MFVRRKSIAEEELTGLPGSAPAGAETSAEDNLEFARAIVQPAVEQRIELATAQHMSRRDLASEIKSVVGDFQDAGTIALNLLQTRDLVTRVINGVLNQPSPCSPAPPPSPGKVSPIARIATPQDDADVSDRRRNALDTAEIADNPVADEASPPTPTETSDAALRRGDPRDW